MRHRSGLRKLNRTSAHRLALLRNLSNALLRHEAIKTTLPKAKELRRVVEPLITLAKNPTVANRRIAFNRLRDREMVVKLFDVLGPRFANRNGGYTRILKMGFRVGDNAPMAYMELTEKAAEVEEVAEEKKESGRVIHFCRFSRDGGGRSAASLPAGFRRIRRFSRAACARSSKPMRTSHRARNAPPSQGASLPWSDRPSWRQCRPGGGP